MGLQVRRFYQGKRSCDVSPWNFPGTPETAKDWNMEALIQGVSEERVCPKLEVK